MNWIRQLYALVESGSAADIAALVADVSALQTAVAAINASITVLNADVVTINAAIAAINATLTSLIFQTVVMDFTQFQTAALSNPVQIFSLPAKSILKNLIIKHSTLFTGTSITSVTAQVGPSGAYTSIIGGFDVKQTVADTAFDNSLSGYIGSFVSATPIYLNMVAVGANLSALSQGSLTVDYEYSTFP